MSLTPHTNTSPATGPHIRLLQCINPCRSMEVIPDYQGDPNLDRVLQDLVLKHGGDTDHEVRLYRIPESEWKQPRIQRQVTKEIWSGVVGYTPSYYEARDTFKEDAQQCWEANRRPGLANSHLCSEYRSPKKLIGSPARHDRQKLVQEFGRYMNSPEDVQHSGPRKYLCSWCRYESDVQRMKADKYGDFSPKLS